MKAVVASSISIEDVVWRLAALASLPYQERWIINGNAQEYLLANELLVDVDALTLRIDRPENRNVLTDLQVSVLKEVLAAVCKHSRGALEGDTPEEHFAIIRNSDAWRQLRAVAAKALLQFGIRIELMSVEDIDKLY